MFFPSEVLKSLTYNGNLHANFKVFNKLGFGGWGLLGNCYIRWYEGAYPETPVAPSTATLVVYAK